MKTIDYKKDAKKIRKRFTELARKALLNPQYISEIALSIISINMQEQNITKAKTPKQRKEEIITYHEKRKKIIRQFIAIQNVIDQDPKTAAYCRSIRDDYENANNPKRIGGIT